MEKFKCIYYNYRSIGQGGGGGQGRQGKRQTLLNAKRFNINVECARLQATAAIAEVV